MLIYAVSINLCRILCLKKFYVSETSNIKKVTLKSGNLTCLEILQLLNKHVSTLAPVEQPVSTVQTKLEKKTKKR